MTQEFSSLNKCNPSIVTIISSVHKLPEHLWTISFSGYLTCIPSCNIVFNRTVVYFQFMQKRGGPCWGHSFVLILGKNRIVLTD